MSIYTIGHSKLSENEFLKLIEGISEVWDIRSHPNSRWPQFQKGNLERWLPKAGVTYHWEPRLGGWRQEHLHLQESFAEYDVDIHAYANHKFPKHRISKEIAGHANLYWYNQGLWDFQFFMTLDEFFDGAKDLVNRSASTNVGIMCCEVLWWQCHRSMVADYLAFNRIDATHLQPKLMLHRKALGNRLERYHPHVLDRWKSAGVAV